MKALLSLAQTTNEYNGTISGSVVGLLLIIYLAVAVLSVAGTWKTYSKAGKPGWAAIIPIYNAYILLKIAGRPGWWLLLYIIPIANIIVSLIVSIDVAKAFGRSEVFGVVALWLFGFVGYPILGFGDDTYTEPQLEESSANI